MKNTLTMWLMLLILQSGDATTYTMIYDGDYNNSSNWDLYPDFDTLTIDDTIKVNTSFAYNASFDGIDTDLGAFILGADCHDISGWNMYLQGDTQLIIEDNVQGITLSYYSFSAENITSENQSILEFHVTYADSSIEFLNIDGPFEWGLYVANGASIVLPQIDCEFIQNAGLLLLNDPYLTVDGELQICGEIRNTKPSNSNLYINCYNFTQEFCTGTGSITGFQNVVFDCQASYITNLTIDP